MTVQILESARPNIVRLRVLDSQVLSENEFIRTNVNAATAGATNAMLGTVVGFELPDGRSLDTPGATLSGTNAAWAPSTRQFTAGSDNSTTDQVVVLVDISKEAKYKVEADADLGTTTNSAQPGYFDLVAGSDQADESTYNATTKAQLYSYGAFDDGSGASTTLIVASIAERQD